MIPGTRRLRKVLDKARAVILTDIDGSMIGYDGSKDGVEEAIEILNSLHIPIIPVTAKTIYEVSYLGDRLGFAREGLIAIVEMGGAICTTKHIPWPGRVVEVEGFQCNLLGDLISDFEHVVEEALGDCRVVRLSKASLDDVERLTGLKGLEALLATKRMFLEVIWSNDRVCLEKASIKLSKAGLYVFLGRRFLHVGSHRGKGDAVQRLLDILRNITINKPRIIGIGDSEADLEFLELVEEPIVIPQTNFSSNLRPRRLDYTIAPYPAPHGWIWAVKQIMFRV